VGSDYIVDTSLHTSSSCPGFDREFQNAPSVSPSSWSSCTTFGSTVRRYGRQGRRSSPESGDVVLRLGFSRARALGMRRKDAERIHPSTRLSDARQPRCRHRRAWPNPERTRTPTWRARRRERRGCCLEPPAGWAECAGRADPLVLAPFRRFRGGRRRSSARARTPRREAERRRCVRADDAAVSHLEWPINRGTIGIGHALERGFGGEVRIVGQLERVHPPRPQVSSPPDPRHGVLGDCLVLVLGRTSANTSSIPRSRRIRYNTAAPHLNRRAFKLESSRPGDAARRRVPHRGSRPRRDPMERPASDDATTRSTVNGCPGGPSRRADDQEY
jgi:hypothetical protein